MSAAPISLDGQIGHLLRRAYQRAAANLARRLAPHGLTVAQFAVLARLGERGQQSQNELGRQAALDPPTMHGVVQRLRGRGLVSIAAAVGDRRRRLLALTPEGAALVEVLGREARDGMAETLAPLATAERETLFALLRRLAD